MQIATAKEANEQYITTGQYIEVNNGVIGEIRNEHIDTEFIDEFKELVDKLGELARKRNKFINLYATGDGGCYSKSIHIHGGDVGGYVEDSPEYTIIAYKSAKEAV